LPAPEQDRKPTVPRSLKGAKTRARLVQAAKEVFEERGFLEARISDIAQHAGLAHGSFYHYFTSKEEVFREVAESVEERLSAPMSGVILDESSQAAPPERIRAGLKLFLESYRREAKIMGVIEQMARYDTEVNALRQERHLHTSQQVAASIRALQRHGLADADLDPVVTAAALGAMSARFAEMWLVQGEVTCGFDRAVDQLTRLFVNALGLRVAPAGARRLADEAWRPEPAAAGRTG
jgi:AcrR family transcriptional regulator